MAVVSLMSQDVLDACFDVDACFKVAPVSRSTPLLFFRGRRELSAATEVNYGGLSHLLPVRVMQAVSGMYAVFASPLLI